MNTRFSLAAIAIAMLSLQAAAHPSSEEVPQPDDLTAYAKCQLDHHGFDDAGNKVVNTPCMQLSQKITKEHFGGDLAKFHKFYKLNETAIIMEVKPDWK